MNIVYRAEKYATMAHEKVNQLFDGLPYSVHLKGVVDVAKRFSHLLPFEEVPKVIVGCWVHDVLEDTHETYNDLKKVLGENAAEYSYALCNEKGRTRDDRANDKYYAGINAFEHATFVKLCDRYFNTEYSKRKGSSMYNKYKKEWPKFKCSLYDGKYQEFWDELEKLY
jgi:(p)ppGpp synthase/HD superfamily hydrolase